jgi:hypothetical protein
MATAKKKSTWAANGRGRPQGVGGSAYRAEYADMAEVAAAEMNATNEQLAALFKTTRQTIQKWITKHPKFAEALTRGKATADDKVKRALFLRATGYDYTERKTVTNTDGKKEDTVFERHAPPDIAACLRWLYNRQPQTWQHTPDLTDGGGGPPVSATINIVAQSARLQLAETTGGESAQGVES